MEEPDNESSHAFWPLGVYVWGGIASLVAAAWVAVLSDGFTDPSIAAPFSAFLAGLGLAMLLTGSIARGILLARAETRWQSHTHESG